MYQEHFGFQNPPFEDRLAQDGEVFIGARQKAALANVKIALAARDAAVVLTGAAGVGKTALGAYSLRTTSTRLALAWIGLAPLTGHVLLEHLLTEFGFDPYKCSRVERLQTWRQFLNEMSLTETRVGILIEKAESLGVDVLQALESLTSATPSGCPGANLILTGDSALRELLKASELESLRQRVRLSQTLDALNAQELSAFLDYKLGAAGGDMRTVFAEGSVAMLHHFSQGRIRVLKNLCETALTIAAARKETKLTPRLIAQVAVGMLGLEPPQAAAAALARPQKPTAVVQETARVHGAAYDSAEDLRQPASDADSDVPTLTDSVEFAADPLLEDVALSERAADSAVSPAPSDAFGENGATRDAAATDAVVDSAADRDGDFNDDEERLDPQQDVLSALANAEALEDISNSMAETLFGDAEWAQLGATLAAADHSACRTGATEDGQTASAQDDEPRDMNEAVGE